MDVEERLALLEAKVELQKRYIHALMSLLPSHPQINAPFYDEIRRFNTEAQSLGSMQAEARKAAYRDLDPIHVSMRGVLALK